MFNSPSHPTLTLANLELMSRPLCFCRLPEIEQPSSTVEFGEGSLDLAFLVDVEDIDALNLLRVIAGTTFGDPAPSDFVAAAEDIQGLEIKRGLCGGEGDERRNAREGDSSFLRMAGYIS